ncbi:MAG: endonuclease domain-containing protein [Anaerolineales bacterium]
MAGRSVVRGQRIKQAKLVRARELRHSMTPEEARLWQQLRANKLSGLHFRRQQVIDGLIADFYCNDAGVVIEIDGPIHEDSLEYDWQRDLVFHGRGLTVLHFTNEEVTLRFGDVLGSIRLACGRRRYPEPPLAP